MNKIILIDYACHPFSLDLANSLAKKNIFVTYFFSENINLTGAYYKKFRSKNLHLVPIKTKSFYKYNFLSRRNSEIEFANKIISFLKNNNSSKVILANVPIDPLYKIIRFCKNNQIDRYFWVQDIYYLAIKNFFQEKKFLYIFFGFFVFKYYKYLEIYCFQNSSANIVIDKNFLKFFPKQNIKSYVIENWVPLIKKKYIPKKKIFKILNLKKKFTFIYTGTLSYKHHFENLIKLAIANFDSYVLIFSNNKFIQEVKKLIKIKKIKNIKIFNPISYDKLHNYLNIADVGLVNLNNKSNNVCVPSKVLTYYLNSLPVLASMPLSNLASKNIIKFKTGLVSDPKLINLYLNNAKLLKENTRLRKKLALNSKAFAKQKFDILKIRSKFIKILEI